LTTSEAFDPNPELGKPQRTLNAGVGTDAPPKCQVGTPFGKSYNTMQRNNPHATLPPLIVSTVSCYD